VNGRLAADRARGNSGTKSNRTSGVVHSGRATSPVNPRGTDTDIEPAPDGLWSRQSRIPRARCTSDAMRDWPVFHRLRQAPAAAWAGERAACSETWRRRARRADRAWFGRQKPMISSRSGGSPRPSQDSGVGNAFGSSHARSGVPTRTTLGHGDAVGDICRTNGPNHGAWRFRSRRTADVGIHVIPNPGTGFERWNSPENRRHERCRRGGIGALLGELASRVSDASRELGPKPSAPSVGSTPRPPLFDGPGARAVSASARDAVLPALAAASEAGGAAERVDDPSDESRGAAAATIHLRRPGFSRRHARPPLRHAGAGRVRRDRSSRPRGTPLPR
jgi:hypothetical protein